jgi:hypothetical protein
MRYDHFTDSPAAIRWTTSKLDATTSAEARTRYLSPCYRSLVISYMALGSDISTMRFAARREAVAASDR